MVDILTEETELAAEDITVPGMPLSFEFDAQWINAYLQDIIDDIGVNLNSGENAGKRGNP